MGQWSGMVAIYNQPVLTGLRIDLLQIASVNFAHRIGQERRPIRCFTAWNERKLKIGSGGRQKEYRIVLKRDTLRVIFVITTCVIRTVSGWPGMFGRSDAVVWVGAYWWTDINFFLFDICMLMLHVHCSTWRQSQCWDWLMLDCIG